MEHEHSIGAIQTRLAEGTRPNYVRDWILGGLDGAVTTFAIVSGVMGAGLAPAVILILGAANIVADGFSMAASNYSGTQSEGEQIDRLRAIEERHIAEFPDGEIHEIREIFRRKGFAGADLDRAVEIITADRDTWISTMLVEEYGVSLGRRSPVGAAASTFSAFLLCGLIPLVPFMAIPAALDRETAFAISIAATGAAFFAIGSMKAKWSLRRWWRSGVETLMLGLAAAGIAFVIGRALSWLI